MNADIRRVFLADQLEAAAADTRAALARWREAMPPVPPEVAAAVAEELLASPTTPCSHALADMAAGRVPPSLELHAHRPGTLLCSQCAGASWLEWEDAPPPCAYCGAGWRGEPRIVPHLLSAGRLWDVAGVPEALPPVLLMMPLCSTCYPDPEIERWER